MVKVIVAQTKKDCEKLLGTFVDESHYSVLVEEDTDCYMAAESGQDDEELSAAEIAEKHLAFKFRKNFFTKQEQEQAYIGLREAATKTFNRGLAAGPKGSSEDNRDWVTDYQQKIIDTLLKSKTAVAGISDILDGIVKDKNNSVAAGHRANVWLSVKVAKDNFNFDEWLTKVKKLPSDGRIAAAKKVCDEYISDTTYATPVNSGIAGWFDRYPRIPYGRATAYTLHHFDKFKLSFPFLQSLNRGFSELAPWRWSNQKAVADKIDQRFLVPGTVFTTVTVNKTFRTACHRDAGDYTKGLSNLLVLSNNGNYSGGYLVFPEYNIAVNVRPGDLLLVNNHEIIHGNTPIVPLDDVAERISLVCYFREKMLELGVKEYEDARFEFIESRRKNLDHAEYHKLWNGVSKNMWKSKEWYDYLKMNQGEAMLKEYHPEVMEKISTLSDFF